MNEELNRQKMKEYNKKNAEKRDEFNKKNYTLFSFRLSNKSDKFLINYLNELDNKTDRIRSLIKQDMSEQLKNSSSKYRSYTLTLNSSDASEKEVIDVLNKQKDQESYIISALKLKALIDKANNKI